MNRRIRNVILTLAAVLVLGGGTVGFLTRFPPVWLRQQTNCPAKVPAGAAEIRQVLGVDVSAADRAVIQSGFSGKRKEIKGKASVAELTARFAGTDPKVKKTLSGTWIGYYLEVSYFRSGTELGNFDFSGTIINRRTDDALTSYSLAKKINTAAIIKAYGLDRS